MNKQRKKPTTEERRWFNMCLSSNDIHEIRMIAQVQEHPRKDVFIISKLFAGYYSDCTVAYQGVHAARLEAMSKMLKAMDSVAEHWNYWRKA